MKFKELRKKVLAANLKLPALDLVIFTWGNVSEVDRENDVFAIKPSGVDYDSMSAEDIVVVSLSTGEVVAGDLKPSSDTETHRVLYNEFPELSGIVHTHSPWAVSWAQSLRALPAYGTTHADTFYGEVPCTRRLTKEELESGYEFNTGKVIVETFKDKELDPLAVPGVLVAEHGPFTWGESADDAVYNAKVLEQCAMTAYLTESINKQAGQQAQPVNQDLLDKHYFRKHGKDAYYGQN